MERGKQIVAQARTYIGVPYHHAQRSRLAIDCVGLLVCVARDLGLCDYDFTDYSLPVPEGLIRQQVLMWCDEVKEMQAGDILLFKFGNTAERHCAIYTGEGTFIHAWDSAGKCVEMPLEGAWARSLSGVFRLR